MVVSGGQTGVDRAALDAALELGLPVGGWCPRGRRAEDGPIAARYPLRETPLARYPQRTAWNVRDSDGTLIVCAGPLSGGTALTAREARRQGRPWLQAAPGAAIAPALAWLQLCGIERLNVAGPRESASPTVYAPARSWLAGLFAAARG